MTFCAAIAMVSTSEPQEHTEQTVNVYLVLPSASIHARSIEFPAPYGTPNIFATSGLEAPRTAEDDGKLPWHVSISLGAGYECSGAIIRSQWILTDAQCVYNL